MSHLYLEAHIHCVSGLAPADSDAPLTCHAIGIGVGNSPSYSGQKDCIRGSADVQSLVGKG